MITVKKIFISFIIAAIPVLSYASSSVGTTVVPFLKYGAGSRAAGMGSAFSAVTNAGSDMIYWNPAGLASVNRKDISLMYLSGIEDISYGWASFAMPTIYGTVGFAVQYMNSGNMEGTGVNAESNSDFSTYDLAVSASYARYHDFGKLGILDYGASLKYIYSKIDNSANAFAVDAGAILTLNDNVTSFGAVLQNAGTKLKYNEEEEMLPFAVRAGASRIFFEKLLVNLDINFPNDNDIFPSFGAEYSINIIEDADIALRAGYDGRQKDIDGFSCFTAGFGLEYRDYAFDYAFTPYGDLGDAHRVSLGISFGEKFDEEKAAKTKAEKQREKNLLKEKKAKEEEEKRRREQERAAMQPEGLDEDYNTIASSAEDEYEREDNARSAVRPARKSIETAAIIDFYSANVPANELGVYSEMLRKLLFETGAFSSIDAAKVKNIYSGNKYPENNDIYNIFKFTKAKKVIAGRVTKKGNSLEFELTVFDDKLRSKKYNITSKDSFRFANEALKGFAEDMAEDIK